MYICTVNGNSRVMICTLSSAHWQQASKLSALWCFDFFGKDWDKCAYINTKIINSTCLLFLVGYLLEMLLLGLKLFSATLCVGTGRGTISILILNILLDCIPLIFYQLIKISQVRKCCFVYILHNRVWMCVCVYMRAYTCDLHIYETVTDAFIKQSE